jgi:flagellar basal-body rod protein FlgC
MDAFGVFRVSASALDAQRQRMNVISSNMANAHSTRSEEGGAYRKKELIFSSLQVDGRPGELSGVKVTDVVPCEEPTKMVFEPSHPDANGEGYVEMPNVTVIEEMVNMMMAFRAYEASVSAFNMSKAMYMKALELGRP